MTRLKFERLNRKWTQFDLAYHSRVQPSEISKIETGRLTPTRASQDRLGRALGIDPAQLLDEVNEPMVVA